MQINELADCIRQTGFEVHVFLKNGFLEKVYENALVNRLRRKGLFVQQQFPIKVYDEDNSIAGEYVADVFVENVLIVEIKAVRTLDEVHIAQVMAYLKASETKHGILMNFGNSKYQIRKFIL